MFSSPLFRSKSFPHRSSVRRESDDIAFQMVCIVMPSHKGTRNFMHLVSEELLQFKKGSGWFAFSFNSQVREDKFWTDGWLINGETCSIHGAFEGPGGRSAELRLKFVGVKCDSYSYHPGSTSFPLLTMSKKGEKCLFPQYMCLTSSVTGHNPVIIAVFHWVFGAVVSAWSDHYFA